MPLTNPVQVPIFSVSVRSTDTEFKALPSSAFEIVPAQGAGKIIRWLGAWMVLDTTEGAYNTPSDVAILQLVYMVPPVGIEASSFVDITAPMQQTGVLSAPITPLASFNATEGYLTWQPSDTGTLIQNVGLGIADIYNGVDDYTGGNPANTLTVSMLYTVIDA